MTTPAPGAQIVMGAEKFEEILCHTLVHIQIGAQRRIEALNRARRAVAFVQQPLDRVQESIRLETEQRLKAGIGAGEQARVLVTLPLRTALLALGDQTPNQAGQGDGGLRIGGG